MAVKADPLIRQIVGRCHVGESNRKVIRYVISCLKRKYKTWQATPKATRREAMHQIIAVHRENRQLYRAVMSGRL
jgi:hypothetical protein